MLLLSLEEPTTTKAPGILAALNNAFKQFDCPDWKSKLIDFCSDGENVNIWVMSEEFKLYLRGCLR